MRKPKRIQFAFFVLPGQISAEAAGVQRRTFMIGKMKIGLRLYSGFGLVVLLMIILGGIALLNIRGMGDSVSDLGDNRIPKLEQIAEITENVYIVEVALREAALSEVQADVNRQLAVIEKAAKSIADILEKMTPTIRSEEGKKLLKEYLDARTAYRVELVKAMGLFREGKYGEARKLLPAMKPLLEKYTGALDKFAVYQKKQAEKSSESAHKKSSDSTLIVIAVIVIASVVALIISIFITRGIVKPLNVAVQTAESVAEGDLTTKIEVKSSDETGQLLAAMKTMVEKLKTLIGDIKAASSSMASGSEQLSASSEEITRTMSDQSNRSNQIAASAEEMSQTVIDIAKNAGNIATAASDTASVAQKGAHIVEKSANESKAISATVDSSARVMQNLGDKSKQIGEIVAVINDIADQTNLLALNAAIEAARAGEQGRGFAVVADEVRKLAERTAKATSEIGSMISAIQGEVDNAVTAMNSTNQQVEVGLRYSLEAGDQLQTIVQSVSALQGMVQQIASATEEMSSTSEAISGDIQAVAAGAREISGGSDQIAQSSSELARLAGQLKSSVDQFKV